MQTEPTAVAKIEIQLKALEGAELKAPIEYASFWDRAIATLIDSVLIMIITLPLTTAIYGEVPMDGYTYLQGGWDLVINYLLPAVAVMFFWLYKSATPGKIYMKIIIVDSKTGDKPSFGQYIVRYIGYIVSILPLGAGIFWILYDTRNQGWHDKMAGTLVIKTAAEKSDKSDEKSKR